MWRNFLAALLMGLVWVGDATAEEMKFGSELTLEAVTKISAILEEPDPFVGKTVLVEGKVVGVCEMRGCWMEILGEKPSAKIRAKVDDGVMVFPQEAMGKTARVEGEFQKFVLSREATLAYKKHHAEEQGKSFDPESVEGPTTLYQIKVQGAVVR